MSEQTIEMTSRVPEKAGYYWVCDANKTPDSLRVVAVRSVQYPIGCARLECYSSNDGEWLRLEDEEDRWWSRDPITVPQLKKS